MSGWAWPPRNRSRLRPSARWMGVTIFVVQIRSLGPARVSSNRPASSIRIGRCRRCWFRVLVGGDSVALGFRIIPLV